MEKPMFIPLSLHSAMTNICFSFAVFSSIGGAGLGDGVGAGTLNACYDLNNDFLVELYTHSKIKLLEKKISLS